MYGDGCHARRGVFHNNAAIILVMRWMWAVFACVGIYYHYELNIIVCI
jgi:hypothetical protein